MTNRVITDWDDAYANSKYIENGSAYPQLWQSLAEKFRQGCTAEFDIAYGEHKRQRYDLFLPSQKPLGLVAFIHGGYWLALDKSHWSHLAAGPVERGYAVAMPSYPLCPEVRIEEIVQMVGQAIEQAAAKVSGPIFLSGHSAGGHLVSSMVSLSSPLSEPCQARVAHTLSISGLHDLRPLLKTQMNAQLGLSATSALHLSPALLEPFAGCRLTAYVGGDERPEFLRQSRLLANIWTGLGAETACVIEPNRHHFDVIEGFTQADSQLLNCLLSTP